MDTHHTVSAFDRELGKLTHRILEMGKLVQSLIDLSLQSFEGTSDSLVKEAKQQYKKITALDTSIDKDATAMIALRQPKAIDLRFILSVIKISTSLERMGDLARNTVKRAKRVEVAVSEGLLEELKDVAGVVKTMLTDVLVAFEKGDVDLASDVWARDDAVNEMYKTLFNKIQLEISQNAGRVPSGVQMIFAAKNIERLGDYTTKLAKNVHYIISGKHVKKKNALAS